MSTSAGLGLIEEKAELVGEHKGSDCVSPRGWGYKYMQPCQAFVYDLFLIRMWMCICMWVCAWNAGAYGSRKCQLSPEAGAIDGYEAPAVGEENHSRVLRKSSARP